MKFYCKEFVLNVLKSFFLFFFKHKYLSQQKLSPSPLHTVLPYIFHINMLMVIVSNSFMPILNCLMHVLVLSLYHTHTYKSFIKCYSKNAFKNNYHYDVISLHIGVAGLRQTLHHCKFHCYFHPLITVRPFLLKVCSL